MSHTRKKWQWWLIGLGFTILMVATIPLAIWVTHTSTAQLQNTKRRCEGKPHATHLVIIKNNQIIPEHTTAVRCDRLVIANLDPQERLIAFGPHDHHVSYDGISEKFLGPGQSLTITLGSICSLGFHDHVHQSVKGDFTVHYN